MKKVKKTLSLSPESIEKGKQEAKKTGTNFSWVVDKLLMALKKSN